MSRYYESGGIHIMKKIEGGVTATKGFEASRCGGKH